MLLVIDESGDDTTAEHRYIIAAACIVDDASLAAINPRLRQIVFANATRTREFHWRREGEQMRTSLIAAMSGHGAIAVFDKVSVAADQEAARRLCLLALFERLAERGLDVKQLMIESREIQPINRGQNHRDHSTIVEARQRNLLTRGVTYSWYPKSEPVGWLADAIAGATLEHFRGDDSPIELLRQSAAWFELVDIDGLTVAKNA